MIPILYESNEIAFDKNGICRLRDCLSCIVTEERNGVYEVEFTYPVTGENYDKITLGRIIGVTHDDTKDIQPFDIVSYEKPINGIVTFHGVHISYRQSKMAFKSTTGVNSLLVAFSQIKDFPDPENPFTYTTDRWSTGYCGAFDGTPRTVRQVLGGVEGSILDTYGGEYEWDKFDVILWTNRGQRRDYTIRYGINLVDYNENTDYSNSYTSVIPFWKGQDDNGNDIIVIGDKVYTGAEPYNGIEACIPLDLSEKFETKPSKASVESMADSILQRTSPDLPKQNITVDFIQLRDTLEYVQFENLMHCNLCDTINVAYKGRTDAYKVVKTVWNVLAERYDSLELGSLSTSLADLISNDGSSSTKVEGIPVYGTCDTAAATAAKEATVSQGFVLKTGVIIFVKFANANTVANPTLNVNGSGAIAIKRYGATNPSTSAESSWNSGSVVALVYDGTYWQMVGWLNTTYSSMSDAEYQAGTSTSARLITPAGLKGAIQYWATTYSSMSDAEYQAGTSTTARLITPAGLKGAIQYWATPSNIGALPISGGTMTGQLKTSFNSSVAMGSYQASATTVDGLLDEVRYSSGCSGSVSINTAYTGSGVTIGTGWYNFLYAPHRSGGVNGSASGDNCNYGSLILMGMTVHGEYIIRFSGSIAEIVKIPTIDGGSLTVSATASSRTTQAVSFNKTFASAPVVVASLGGSLTAVNTANTQVSAYNPTTTGFTLYLYNNTTSDKNLLVRWIAINV